jgi:PAS domain S-box-containing protein/putative nucleotidyltransferase with HDIG domain
MVPLTFHLIRDKLGTRIGVIGKGMMNSWRRALDHWSARRAGNEEPQGSGRWLTLFLSFALLAAIVLTLVSLIELVLAPSPDNSPHLLFDLILSGVLLGLALAARIISAQLQSSLAHARDLETRLGALINKLPGATYLCEVGAHGRWLYASAQVESIAGFSISELQDDPDLWFSRIHADDRARVLDEWTRCGETGAPLHTEYRLLTRDGSEIWIHNDAAVVSSPGQPDLFQGILFDITERKRSAEELQRHADELAALTHISREIMSVSDLSAVLASIAQHAARLCNADASGVYESDDNGQIRIVASFGVGQEFIEALNARRIAPDEGAIGRATSERRPVVVSDTQSEPGYPFSAPTAKERIRAVAAAPMLRGDQVIGGIVLWHRRPQHFSARQVYFLQALAQQCVNAVENARLFAETTRRVEQLGVINTAAIRIQQRLDSRAIFQAASDEVCRLGTFAHVLLASENETLEHIHTSMSAAMLEEYVAAFGEKEIAVRVPLAAIKHEWERLSAGETFIAPGLLPRIISGFAPDARPVGEWILERARNSVMLIAPLARGDQTLGAIAIIGDHLSASDIPALSLFARHVSVALENAHLFQQIQAELTERKRAEEKIQHQLQRLAALHSIDAAISSSLDLRVTLDIIVEEMLRQLRVDAASILLLNPYLQLFEYAAGRGFRTRVPQQTKLPLGRDYAGRAALERRAIHVPNLADADSDYIRALLRSGERFVSYYAAPLIAKGEIKGVLQVFHRTALQPSQEWLDFLQTLAAQTAIAIDNMSLFDTLQRSNIELALAYDTTLEGWSRALERRDRETQGHTLRVADLAVRLAKALGVRDAELPNIRRGALLHDIGKMGIPDSILLKPGPLSDEEWDIMKQHPTFAYELLSPITYLQPALDIPYCHHEHWNGLGYPRGLAGEEIPLAARIFAVVDVWDALLSERPYRTAWTEEDTRVHIASLAGAQFDPRIVKTFLELEDISI